MRLSSTNKVMSLTLAGMILAMFVDVLLAARLGAGKKTDTLVIALTIPLLLDTVSRESTKFSLVPILRDKGAELRPEDFLDFLGGVMNLFMSVGLVCLISLELFVDRLLALIAPGLSPASLQQGAVLLRLAAPLALFGFANTVLAALLNSHKHFGFAALRNAVAPALVAITILVFWHSENIALWVAGAYAAGSGLFFAVLAIRAYSLGLLRWRLRWIGREDLRVLLHQILPPTIGFCISQGVILVQRSVASLVAVGGVASFYFAFRIFSGIQTILGVSIATTALPDFSDYGRTNRTTHLAQALRRKLKKTVLVALGVSLALALLHYDIIRILYGHGSFDQQAVATTSSILLWLSTGIVFNCCIPVLNSSLYAQYRPRLVLANMAFFSLLNASLIFLFGRLWGLTGIAVATSISALASSVNLLFILGFTGVNLWPKKMEAGKT